MTVAHHPFRGVGRVRRPADASMYPVTRAGHSWSAAYRRGSVRVSAAVWRARPSVTRRRRRCSPEGRAYSRPAVDESTSRTTQDG